VSEKLGGSHEPTPEIGDFNTKPESELSVSQPPTVNTYGLKPEDVEQLQRLFDALAKGDLIMPAFWVGITNRTQREQLRQYPNIFNEPPARRRLIFPFNLIRGIGSSFVIFLKVVSINTVLTGERSKEKPHYTFDLGHLVENGIELHILCTILRQSKNKKVLDMLPDENLTEYLYGNAGRHEMWGIPFDRQPLSFPTRTSFNEVEEL
jgi:hypothetical protein